MDTSCSDFYPDRSGNIEINSKYLFGHLSKLWLSESNFTELTLPR